MVNYRKFDKESDYIIMRNIVQHNCVQTGHLYPQIHIGNLDFERYAYEESPDLLYNITSFVIFDNKEIGFFSAYDDEFYIVLIFGFEYLIPDVIDYIENNCYSKGKIITTEANSNHKHLNNILEKKGYIKTDFYRFCGICELSKIKPYPSLPEGYSIRITEKRDIARRVELFGLATGGSGTSSDRYERMMNSISYRDALDLVVETNNKEIIAYCTIWEDPLSKTGILEPVACVEEHRRKGIMKSTLLYGMNLLKDRGTKYMYVGTGGKNLASQNLYKSVGFLEYGTNCEWQKTL